MFTALDIQNTQYTKIGNTAIDQQVSHVPYNEILCSNKKELLIPHSWIPSNMLSILYECISMKLERDKTGS